MIILRFLDLLYFLEKEYGIKITQQEFSERSGISPDRLSRLKIKDGEPVTQNVNTKLLNQLLEGTWKIILDSGRNIKEYEKQDVFCKLVTILIDYIPDSNNSVYSVVLKNKESITKNLRRYLVNNSRLGGEDRENFRKGLISDYNQKNSLK